MVDEDYLKSRPEAQAFGIDKLNKSQRKALKMLLKKLDWACTDVEKRSKDITEKPDLRWTINIPKNNPNRVFFLTGGRGYGKTSVLFSLINLIGNKLLKDDSQNNKIINLAKNLKHRLIWLYPLEMETLPSSTNLLAAILSRVDMAIDRFRSHHPMLHEPKHSFGMHPEEQEILLNFMKLQQDVALAWSGNIEKRAGSMDPDVYALEVLRAEQKRINLNERIEKTLDDLCNKFIPSQQENGNPCIFVLPVDDFDMNPERCFELIRMIRMFNTPRLYTIILGDQRILSHQLSIQFLKSLIKSDISPQSPLFSNDISYEERRLSHELSANAMRKLFAPGNRISLGPMKKDEVFKFNSNSKKSIKELLKTFTHITLNTAFQENKKKKNETKFQIIAGKKFESVFDLFNLKIDDLIHIDPTMKGALKIEENKDEYIYVGKHLFTLSARHTQDLWNYLFSEFKKEFKKEGNDENISFSEKKLVRFARTIFCEKIREGETLTMRSHGRLNSILKKDFSGDLQFATSDLEFAYNYGESISIPQSTTSIGIHFPKDWDIIIKETMFQQDRSKDRRDVKVMDTTAAGIVFLHDLLAFANPQKIIGKKFLRQKTPPLWAFTQWYFGGKEKNIKIAWPFPDWLTMFECDILRRSWVRVWRWVGYVKRNVPEAGNDCLQNEKINDRLKEALAEYLPYAWIKIITGILAGPCVYKKRLEKLKDKNEEIQKIKNDIENMITIIEEHIEKRDETSTSYSVPSDQTDEDLNNYKRSLKKRLELIDQKDNVFNLIECFRNSKLFFDKLVNYSIKLKISIPEFKIEKSTKELFNTCSLLALPTISSIKDQNLTEEISLVKEDEWETLIQEIENLVDNGKNQYESRQLLIHSWISSVVCMMAPEYDLPEKIQKVFNDSINSNNDSRIKKILKTPEISNSVRNLRAKNAAMFLNNHAFGKIPELFFPVHPSKKLFEIFNQKEFCPFIDTMIINSEQSRELSEMSLTTIIDYFDEIKEKLKKTPKTKK